MQEVQRSAAVQELPVTTPKLRDLGPFDHSGLIAAAWCDAQELPQQLMSQ